MARPRAAHPTPISALLWRACEDVGGRYQSVSYPTALMTFGLLVA